MTANAPHSTPVAGSVTPPVKTPEAMKIILFIFLGFVFFIAIVILWITSSDDNPKENTQKNITIQEESYIKIKNVLYGPNYGEIIYLPAGFKYHFEEATEPYCFSNKNNEQACGEKGEDVSNELGDSSANKSLRFRSQNGKKGSIKIILTKKR